MGRDLHGRVLLNCLLLMRLACLLRLKKWRYALTNFGQLSEKEQAQIKEQLNPLASGGMNGFLALCNGDPCPPVFRSPVEGMEDIMDNQVIFSICKLPDVHKHIAQPPAGVILPKKDGDKEDQEDSPGSDGADG